MKYEHYTYEEGPMLRDGKSLVGYYPLCNGTRLMRYDYPTHRYISFPTIAQCEGYVKRMNNIAFSQREWDVRWQRAWTNTPVRKAVRQHESWVLHEQPTPIGDYIKGHANDTMKIVDGCVYELQVTEHSHYYGRDSCMARLLGYYGNKKHGTPNHLLVMRNRHNGARPRSAEARERLMLLSQHNGFDWAMQQLKAMGIAHRYMRHPDTSTY